MYHALSPDASPPPLPSQTDAPPSPTFSDIDIDIDTSPPPLPPDSVYTSCYCEENIYLLAQAFTLLSDADSTADNRGLWPWQIYVVFVSNGGKTVRDSITFSPPHFKVATAAFISLDPLPHILRRVELCLQIFSYMKGCLTAPGITPSSHQGFASASFAGSRLRSRIQ